jgi:hypothetical protein
MPLLQKDIRKLQPPVPPSVRRRDSASPFVSTDSKTSFSQARPSTGTIASTRSLSLSLNPSRKQSNGESGRASTSPASPVVYWSEFESQEEEPYTVGVDESSPLLPWLRKRKQRDLEHGPNVPGETSFLSRMAEKVRGIVEFEVQSSADGLTTLFYEKGLERAELGEDDDEYNSEASSDEPVSPETSQPPHHGATPHHPPPKLTRPQLLNRGYALCVIGCVMLSCIFGIVGLLLKGQAAGIASVLVGFLISMTLEIFSLVRFIMYLCSPLDINLWIRKGGHSGIAWIGLLVVVAVCATFIPLVAFTEEG